jgi:uncharacterized metal-binding protein
LGLASLHAFDETPKLPRQEQIVFVVVFAISNMSHEVLDWTGLAQ